jgi:uncharacterized phage protein (TIGR02218 family)
VTYLTDETDGLDPIELYEFSFGTQFWRFTDSDVSFLFASNTYTPETISRGPMRQSDEDGSMSVEVVVDALCPIADFFRVPFLPAQQLWLTIYRTHVGSAFSAVIFRGRVGQCVFDHAVAKLTAVPMRNAIQKTIPVQLIQRLCNNTLYDQRCKANPLSFKFTGTISSLTGLVITVTGTPGAQVTGYFDGGFIQKTGLPAATIIDHTVAASIATMRLLYNPGYVNGDVIDCYAGCDKRYPTCRDKFANTLNHQGCPQFPTFDPFRDEMI